MSKEVDIGDGRIKSSELVFPIAVPTSTGGTKGDGLMYYNTSDNKIYVYYGGTWRATSALT